MAKEFLTKQVISILNQETIVSEQLKSSDIDLTFSKHQQNEILSLKKRAEYLGKRKQILKASVFLIS